MCWVCLQVCPCDIVILVSGDLLNCFPGHALPLPQAETLDMISTPSQLGQLCAYLDLEGQETAGPRSSSRSRRPRGAFSYRAPHGPHLTQGPTTEAATHPASCPGLPGSAF